MTPTPAIATREPVTLRTGRLLLRPWVDADLPAFAAINADPDVMAHLPAVLDRAASDALANRLRQRFAERGWGLWVVEVPGKVDFAGFVGLNPAPQGVPFGPAIEVGWRLARVQWGKGYATEGARAAIAFAFDRLGLDEVVSFTVPANRRSIAVMERLGLTRDPADDFDHPALPEGHPLRRHVLYRRRRSVGDV